MSVLFAVIKSNRSITVKAYGAYAADKPPESIEITRRAPGEHDIQIDIAYCGERHFTAAPALKWSAALFEAARAHSQDMARQRYFSHTGKDGREVEERAVRAGYRWRGIGENIAAGQASPEEAMAG